MKRLVTANEIRDLHFSGRRRLVLPEGAIITPGARDLIYAFNIEVQVARDTAGGAGGTVAAVGGADESTAVGACGAVASAVDTPGPGDSLPEAVRRVVDSVLADGSPEDRRRVIDAVVDQLSARSCR